MTNTQPELNLGVNSAQGTVAPRMYVCHTPQGEVPSDRMRVQTPFVAGRSSQCALAIDDNRMSKLHFKIEKQGNSYVLEDLNSTNHTWLNGMMVQGVVPLPSGSIIRAGDTVLCFEQLTSHVATPAPLDTYGIDGRFYVQEILATLQEAALSDRHVLICGPSGSGKELAAKALTQMYSEQSVPMHMVSHNGARFSSEEEAASTLFGIAPKAFTNVGVRAGLIEQADGGVLFLDEIHNLPLRVQRSLLRVIEDGAVSRIGETAVKRVTVRFIFASNDPGEFHGLAPDLYARCRVIQLSGLCERRADISTVFKATLRRFANKYHLDSEAVWLCVTSSHIEAMCLDGFPNDNVRGVIDLCDRIVTRIKATADIQQAVESIFQERFAASPVLLRASVVPETSAVSLQRSTYDRNRQIITEAFKKCRGNFSAMERLLKKSGISCSRRWLKEYAEKWQLKTEID